MKKLLIIISLAFITFGVRAQNADTLMYAKEYVKAAEAYQLRLKEQPDNVVTLRRLGFCYLNIQNTDALAENYFQKALKLDPKDQASNYYLGLMSKKALANNLTPAQRKAITIEAKTYLQNAAAAGSEDAVKELESFK